MTLVNTREGFQLHVDPDDQMVSRKLQRNGFYEPGTVREIKRLKPGSKFLDAGAHIGYFSMIAVRAVGPIGSVVAYEPNPQSFAFLERNIKEWGAANVFAQQAALSDKSGKGKLYLHPTNTGDCRTYPCKGHPKEVEVLLHRADDLWDRMKFDLIKIDVQGWEIRALQGMSQILRNGKGHTRLIVEYWPRGLTQAGEDPEELFTLLKAAEYEPQGGRDAVSFGTQDHTNVLFTPKGE